MTKPLPKKPLAAAKDGSPKAAPVDGNALARTVIAGVVEGVLSFAARSTPSAPSSPTAPSPDSKALRLAHSNIRGAYAASLPSSSQVVALIPTPPPPPPIERVSLKAFREAMIVTREKASRRAGLKIDQIVRFEQSTLNIQSVGVVGRLVEAAGGKLELVAVDDVGRRYVLTDPEKDSKP